MAGEQFSRRTNLLRLIADRKFMSLLVDEGGRGFKRPRTEFIGTARTKRPIDKKLVTIANDATAGTQVTTTLITATFPCTITGLRWSLAFVQDGGAGVCLFWWAIVIVRDGVTIDTLATSNGAVFFNPEQNCLVFGNGIIDADTETKTFVGATKTMRKLMGGDTLQFVTLGGTTNTSGSRGIIQFFCKT